MCRGVAPALFPIISDTNEVFLSQVIKRIDDGDRDGAHRLATDVSRLNAEQQMMGGRHGDVNVFEVAYEAASVAASV